MEEAKEPMQVRYKVETIAANVRTVPFLKKTIFVFFLKLLKVCLRVRPLDGRKQSVIEKIEGKTVKIQAPKSSAGEEFQKKIQKKKKSHNH